MDFINGYVALDVRVDGKVTRVKATEQVTGKATLNAQFDTARLCISDGDGFKRTQSPVLIQVQPKDGLSVSEDTLSAAGDYPDGNQFNGKVLSYDVKTAPGG